VRVDPDHRVLVDLAWAVFRFALHPGHLIGVGPFAEPEEISPDESRLGRVRVLGLGVAVARLEVVGGEGGGEGEKEEADEGHRDEVDSASGEHGGLAVTDLSKQNSNFQILWKIFRILI